MSSDNINLEFIERYQKLYEKDPKSKVFAPLGEAYRKMGLLKEATDILKIGVNLHPNFASGRVAYAKVLMDQKDFENATVQLKAAVENSAENLLAQRLLAECHVNLRQLKDALKAYKMVLFLNPNDAHAQMHIRKLESLTADEYDEDVFEMKPLKADIALKSPTKASSKPGNYKNLQLERIVSLADAFIARFDFDRALETIESSENLIGTHPELEKRKNFISSKIQESHEFNPDEITNSDHRIADSTNNSRQQRIDILKNLLHKIESQR